ncbi:MAG: discoidin domain-containing protein [Actinomycetota bacterium]|nr:discoidin domain-containing protein [Actinomycetota bacterium]
MRTRGLLAALLVAAAAASSPAVASAAPPCQDGQGWSLSTSTFDPNYTHHAFVGNGYLSQRVPATGMGYVSTGEKTGWPLYTPRYDGAFVAGLYGLDPTLIPPGADRARVQDAAIPTWSTLTVGTGSDVYTPTTPGARVSRFKQTLYMACGLLRTTLTWTATDGKATDLVYDVIARRGDPHVGAVRVQMTPRWSGEATVTDVLDGAGARRLVQTGGGAYRGDPTIDVNFTTQTLGTAGTVASTLGYGSAVKPSSSTRSKKATNLTASQSVTFPVSAGTSYELYKYVGVDTALTSSAPETAAVAASQGAAAQGWTQLFAGHSSAWNKLWSSDIQVSNRPDLQDWLRANTYALLSSIRSGADDSVAPTGLSSDNYAGLIFWDAEIWMYPSLLLQHPDVAESVIEFRRKTLPGARSNALQYGLSGVFFPWNGAGTGDLDSECHSWNPPHCLTQIHLQGDIALATWQYYLATGDKAWLSDHWSILEGIAQFWAGKATANGDGTYSILHVAGPDEYSNDVRDGVFTNGVAATALRDATRAAQVLGLSAPPVWTQIADKLRMPFGSLSGSPPVFIQYDGYQGSVIKQADTVLLIYPLEWPMTKQVAADTLDFYAERTDPDGPAMTDAIHAVDSAQIGEPGCATHTYLMRSIVPFLRDPYAQFAEARGDKAGSLDPLAGSPAFNFLTGSGGFTQVFSYGLTGLRWRENAVHLDPMLPPQLSGGVTLTGLHWQGRTFDIQIGATTTTVISRSGGSFPVEAPSGMRTVSAGGKLSLPTRRPDLDPTTNLARCKPATATSEEAGMYAEAAVDGSRATIWAPTATTASLTVDLRQKQTIGRVVTRWTDTVASSSRILTSPNGNTWTAATVGSDGTLASPTTARYVRVEITRLGTERTGLRELEVYSD